MKLHRPIPQLTRSEVFGLAFVLALFIGFSGSRAAAQCPNDEDFTTDFRLQDCEFKPNGANPFFSLQPGLRLVLEGEDEGETLVLEITVLDETEVIDLSAQGLGMVTTRVVEERETVDGEEEELSRNFFARCKQTNAIYYFGEEVDPPAGSWRAGTNDAMPGLIMPGTFLLGSKYFQEQAPNDDAVDRGENTAMGLDVSVPAGDFTGCVEVVDTNPVDDVCDVEDGDVKVYCPGIGLTMDEDLQLTAHGDGGLLGRTLTYRHNYPQKKRSTFEGPTDVVVGPGVELEGIGFGRINLDISASNLRLEWTSELSLALASFNGQVYSDKTRTVRSFESVTVNPETSLAGFDQSRVTFDDDNIWIDFAGLGGDAGTVVSLDITLAP